MANRKVSTEAGAKFFGKPIGSPITEEDDKNASGRNRPVTLLRLKSLQRQFIQAKRTQNAPLMAAVNKQFKQEIKIFMDVTGNSFPQVLDSLDANLDDGLKESSEVSDKDTADGDKAPAESSGEES